MIEYDFSKIENFKNKILKLNDIFIFVVVIAFSAFSFLSVYYVLNQTLKRDIQYTKQEYVNSKKASIKTEVENLVNFIEYTTRVETQKKTENLKYLATHIKFIIYNTSKKQLPVFLYKLNTLNPDYQFAVLKTSKVIYRSSTLPENVIKARKLVKPDKVENLFVDQQNYFAYRINALNGYNIFIVINKSNITRSVKQKIIKFVDTMHFIYNNGYLSIIEIKNFSGGKKFAKFVAYPKNPEWEGLYLNDSKKDAKGIEYRKVYLQILRKKGEGFFVYWFKKDGRLYKKISYVKLYKPFNWAIFGGIYISDIDKVILQKEKVIQSELRDILKIYLFLSLVMIAIIYFLTKYEDKMIKNIIDTYEKEILKKQKELEEINYKLDKLNKNLKREVEAKTKELLRTLFVDKLTGLPNREKFLHDLKDKKCVAILNIDSFKELNSFYGVEIGDMVLRKVGRFINRFVEVYKLSADEYGILGNDCGELEKKAEEIVHIVEKHNFNVENHIINISLSVGIGKNIEEADMALKYAKNKKLHIVTYSDTLEIVKEYKEYLEWKNIIKEAIKNDRIIPFIQAIVDSKTYEVAKYEVLIRLYHEGKYYPPFFLEYAKKAGLYVDLQKIVIRKSFEVFSKKDIKFSINCSVIELSHIGFREYLLNMIEKYNVSNKLTVEILEDEKLKDEEIRGFLIYLKEMMDVEIAIDDFGSGNSNISYLLEKFPVTILKIDGSLIKDISHNENNKKLIQVISNMAKIFNLDTIAEFVEDDKIAEILREYGIDYLQGYHFSKPFSIYDLKD